MRIEGPHKGYIKGAERAHGDVLERCRIGQWSVGVWQVEDAFGKDFRDSWQPLALAECQPTVQFFAIYATQIPPGTAGPSLTTCQTEGSSPSHAYRLSHTDRPCPQELHNQWQYYESIHKKGRQQKLKEQGEDTGYCTSSDSEPEKDYDGHSDSVGLHEPRTFPAVTMNYCSVNRAKFAGSPKPAREFRTYTPPRVPKRDWETERGPMETRRAFKNLTQRTAQEDNAHRLRPSEQRIADLQEPWDPPTWPFDREDDRTGTFTVYAKPRSLELPPSVHINQV